MLAATTACTRNTLPVHRATCDLVPIHQLPPEAVFYVPNQPGVLLTLLIVNGKPCADGELTACVVLDVAAPPYATRAVRGQLRHVAITEPVIQVVEVQRALYAVKPR